MSADVVTIPGWITSAQAADRLRCTVNYVYLLRRTGRLRSRCLGAQRIYLYPEEDVEAYRQTHPRLGQRIGSRSLTKT